MSKSSPYTALDTSTMPLTGVSLIEANAGTGKTYSIASLYLRLIVENQLNVDQILVVSFTEAATAELRGRIRQRLIELRRVLETAEPGTTFEHQLAESLPDQTQALTRVVRALQSFDEAAISTIHGFCQKLLAESAFEAGVSFESQLVPDDIELRRQIIDDFWRERTQQGSAHWLAALLDECDPDKLAQDLGEYFARPQLRFLAPTDVQIDPSLEAAFAAQTDRLRQLWMERGEDVLQLLSSVQKQLFKVTYGGRHLGELGQTVNDWAQGQSLDAKRYKVLAKLRTSTLASKTLKKFEPPRHDLFDEFEKLFTLAEQLQDQTDKRIARFRADLLEYAERELPLRKAQLRVRHFDDLLRDVFVVLQSPQGEYLRKAAQQRFSAALIDEFQDTDPVQFAIFEGLFANSATSVIFVGDPKQAIYSFRGADIFAYLEARQSADNFYRLNTNYRSTPELVESANRIFSVSDNPFLNQAIDYSPSVAKHSDMALCLDDAALPAMQWWYFDNDKTLKADDARLLSAETTASEIARLLALANDGRLTMPASSGTPGASPLQARDIAVLVRTHKEGDIVREALSRRAIACVQMSESSVYETVEAQELALILRAIAHPASARTVRAALATDLLGYSAARIEALAGDDEQWQTLLDLMVACNQLWHRRNFAAMHRSLMREFDIERRLLGLPQGQRRLTNLMHLEDLLQAEASLGRNPDELLSWFDAKCSSGGRPIDQSALLRLESDENLVSIVTMHNAKGLQYPVVFCPFLFSGMAYQKGTVTLFHDDNNESVLDLGSDDAAEHCARAEVEAYAESLRLVYVALTRAELACFATFGDVRQVENAAMGWLLHSKPNDTLTTLKKRIKSLDTAGLIAPLRRLAEAYDPIRVDPLPAATDQMSPAAAKPRDLVARRLTRDIAPGWRVTSFSALARHGDEQPRDYDAHTADSPVVVTEPRGIFAFPRGARAGRCMHMLFEWIDFADTETAILPVAENVLRLHGYDETAAPVLSEMAVNVLRTDLLSGRSLRLADVAAGQRVSEMEFYFPTASLNARRLREALGDFGAATPIAPRLETLNFRLGRGFMHGFIDLCFEHDGRFYLVDYKSNWLGGDYPDYRDARLNDAIAKHDYYLQYLIYTVALHRHLQRIKPGYDYDTHFGGAFYLFLRGIHPRFGAGSGVYHDRPSRQLVVQLEQALCGGDPVTI